MSSVRFAGLRPHLTLQRSERIELPIELEVEIVAACSSRKRRNIKPLGSTADRSNPQILPTRQKSFVLNRRAAVAMGIESIRGGRDGALQGAQVDRAGNEGAISGPQEAVGRNAWGIRRQVGREYGARHRPMRWQFERFHARGLNTADSGGTGTTTARAHHEVSGDAACGKPPTGKVSTHTMCPCPQRGHSRSDLPVSCSKRSR